MVLCRRHQPPSQEDCHQQLVRVGHPHFYMVCISLMVREAEHLSFRLLINCLSSHVGCPSMLPCPQDSR